MNQLRLTEKEAQDLFEIQPDPKLPKIKMITLPIPDAEKNEPKQQD